MNAWASLVPETTTGDISPERWAELTQVMRGQEARFRRLADEHKLQLLSSSRWPELRLRQCSALMVREARLSVAADTMQRRHPDWVVSVVHYPRFPRLFARRHGSTEVARIASHDLQRDSDQVKDAIHGALQRLLGSE